MPKYRIPKDWFGYPKMGELVQNSRFMAMKVPLKSRFRVQNKRRFNCQTAIEMVEEKNLKIGMVVNLCDSDKYYSEEHFIKSGAVVKRIPVAGKKLPRKVHVRRFCSVVTKFEKENKDNNNIILVHCTHGVNRTGFLICKYLIEVNDMKPIDAIESFEKARGVKIRRPEYVTALLKTLQNNTYPNKIQQKLVENILLPSQEETTNLSINDTTKEGIIINQVILESSS